MKHMPLVEANKIYLPTLDIKLDLLKNFIKAVDKKGE